MTGPQSRFRRWYGFERRGPLGIMEEVSNRSGDKRLRKRWRCSGDLYWFGTEGERTDWCRRKTKRQRVIVSTRFMPYGWLAVDAVACRG